MRNMKSCLDNGPSRGVHRDHEAHVARLILGWGRASVRETVTVGRRLFWGGHTLARVERFGPARGFRDRVALTPMTWRPWFLPREVTGPPKGVVYRHGNFLPRSRACARSIDFGPGEVNLPTFPLFALFDPALGMTTVIPDMDPTRPARVRPENIVGPIQEFGVTTMFGSPALSGYRRPLGQRHGVRLPTLKRVISAGAPVAPQVIERFSKMLHGGAEILTPYGATEALAGGLISSREILGDTGAPATRRGHLRRPSRCRRSSWK